MASAQNRNHEFKQKKLQKCEKATGQQANWKCSNSNREQDDQICFDGSRACAYGRGAICKTPQSDQTVIRGEHQRNERYF